MIRKECNDRKGCNDEEKLDLEPEIYQKLMDSYDESREEWSKKYKSEERPIRRAPPTTNLLKSNNNCCTNLSRACDSSYTQPKFTVKQQADIEMEEFTNNRDSKMYSTVPRRLIVTIDLPLLKTANDAKLDVREKLLSLISEKPAKYMLELPLPYSVDPDEGNAKFDAKTKKLCVTLPVKRSHHCHHRLSKEDSGVDSDHESPENESNYYIILFYICEYKKIICTQEKKKKK